MSSEELDLLRPLDESLYSLEPEDIRFLGDQTGIHDAEELKKHILKVQADIYAIHPYHCIRGFGFAKLKLSLYPAYEKLLRLGRERKGALFLDLGCCVGNDTRKAVADGFPVYQTIASDLHPEFWAAGHQLFKSTPESFPVPFIPGDAFDDRILKQSPLPTAMPSGPPPQLSELTTLTPLIGRLSAIHTSSFFHLFPEDKQFEMAKRLASLLSPEPGSMIFGGHVGLPVKGHRDHKNSHKIFMFCHSPESWKDLWENHVFAPGQVKVETILRESGRISRPTDKIYFLVWSVTRL